MLQDGKILIRFDRRRTLSLPGPEVDANGKGEEGGEDASLTHALRHATTQHYSGHYKYVSFCYKPKRGEGSNIFQANGAK